MERKDVRILVVDDEPVMTDSLKQNLVEEGYTVDTASNGARFHLAPRTPSTTGCSSCCRSS